MLKRVSMGLQLMQEAGRAQMWRQLAWLSFRALYCVWDPREREATGSCSSRSQRVFWGGVRGSCTRLQFNQVSAKRQHIIKMPPQKWPCWSVISTLASEGLMLNGNFRNEQTFILKNPNLTASFLSLNCRFQWVHTKMDECKRNIKECF